MTNDMLNKMLRDGARFAPHYKPVNNSDHLPMALCAMVGLGASDEALRSFRDVYAQKLHDWPDKEVVTLASWQDGLGRYKAFGALKSHFKLVLEERPVDAVIEEVCRVTLPGVALDAFHPIIRLGYALEFEAQHQSREELAAALGYMVALHQSLPVSREPIDLSEVLRHQVDQGPVKLSSQRFGAAIAELVSSGRYPQGSAESLEELASTALAIYRGTRNFFALHLVTSNQALRCVCERLSPDTRELAVASMTSAILASHLVLGSPGYQDVQPPPGALDAEHCFKYVWSCVSEFQSYGRDVYLDEAAGFRDVGLVPDWVKIS